MANLLKDVVKNRKRTLHILDWQKYIVLNWRCCFNNPWGYFGRTLLPEVLEHWCGRCWLYKWRHSQHLFLFEQIPAFFLTRPFSQLFSILSNRNWNTFKMSSINIFHFKGNLFKEFLQNGFHYINLLSLSLIAELNFSNFSNY